jgi:hypothetical protein
VNRRIRKEKKKMMARENRCDDLQILLGWKRAIKIKEPEGNPKQFTFIFYICSVH